MLVGMLGFYTAASIENKTIEQPLPIVEGLLPVGLAVLAGHPKLGKSFLSLLACVCVSEGMPFLGRPTMQGACLYIDLEGSPYRTQQRLNMIGLGFPEYLQIVHDAPRLGEGLIEALEQWYCEVEPIPRLVVIDTITRARGNRHRNETAYDSDSKMFAPLQKFALEKQLCILLVTHLKKSNYHGESEDWLERLNGSMGLSGACDTVLGLFRKRGESTAILRTSCRDFDAGDAVLKFDDGLWTFVSDNVDAFRFQQNPLVKFIASIDIFSGTASELCEMYVDFCEKEGIPHGLSTTSQVASFGKKIGSIKNDMWRIRRSVTSERQKDGMHYCIRKYE